MDRYVLNAAGMDVYLAAKKLEYHRGAFNVPPGESFAPGALPAKMRVGFPKYEVVGPPFTRTRFHPRARLKTAKLDAAELAVGRKTGNIKIDTILRAVPVSLFFKCFYQRYLFKNIIAGAGVDSFFRINTERAHVVKIKFRKFLRKYVHVFKREYHSFAFEPHGHFVLALVGVACEMPEVGNIGHLAHVISPIIKDAAQNIENDRRAQIADMLAVVDRRSAVVHFDRGRREGNELLRFSRKSIVQKKRRKRCGGRFFSAENLGKLHGSDFSVVLSGPQSDRRPSLYPFFMLEVQKARGGHNAHGPKDYPKVVGHAEKWRMSRAHGENVGNERER